MKAQEKVRGRIRRHSRVRKKIVGTADRPRLAVYRSNRHIYAQLIDDFAHSTLASSSTLAVDADGDPKARAKAVGMDIAKKAKGAGIGRAIFDRGGFRYHGRIESVADGAREGGLEF
ncbi:MAG: large subunit ribosomal protein [Actinomycetota bacterium]|nr:large subunit ribosomal protein [Actinomycetota bacterium]